MAQGNFAAFFDVTNGKVMGLSADTESSFALSSIPGGAGNLSLSGSVLGGDVGGFTAALKKLFMRIYRD